MEGAERFKNEKGRKTNSTRKNSECFINKVLTYKKKNRENSWILEKYWKGKSKIQNIDVIERLNNMKKEIKKVEEEILEYRQKLKNKNYYCKICKAKDHLKEVCIFNMVFKNIIQYKRILYLKWTKSNWDYKRRIWKRLKNINGYTHIKDLNLMKDEFKEGFDLKKINKVIELSFIRNINDEEKIKDKIINQKIGRYEKEENIIKMKDKEAQKRKENEELREPERREDIQKMETFEYNENFKLNKMENPFSRKDMYQQIWNKNNMNFLYGGRSIFTLMTKKEEENEIEMLDKKREKWKKELLEKKNFKKININQVSEKDDSKDSIFDKNLKKEMEPKKNIWIDGKEYYYNIFSGKYQELIKMEIDFKNTNIIKNESNECNLVNKDAFKLLNYQNNNLVKNIELKNKNDKNESCLNTLVDANQLETKVEERFKS